MQKPNMFHDKEYCKLLAMCMYKHPYTLNTFILESNMSETVMNLPEASALFGHAIKDLQLDEEG